MSETDVDIREGHVEEAYDGCKPLNRVKVWLENAKQSEIIGELDQFSASPQFNLGGETTFKTQFGGLMNLIVIVICVIFTWQTQFPNGLQLNANIVGYELIQDAGKTQGIFDHTDTFCSVKFFDFIKQQYVTLGDKVTVFAYLATDKGNSSLQISKDCSQGQFCLKNSAVNKEATLFGVYESGESYSTLNLEVVSCDSNDPTFIDNQTFMSACWDQYSVEIHVLINNFQEDTNTILPYTDRAIFNTQFSYNLAVNRQEYSTNNKWLGHVSNQFPRTLYYYSINTRPYTSMSYPVFNTLDVSNRLVTTIQFGCSGTTDIITQQFDDVTLPILFFLSLYQTLNVIVFYCLVKQYNSNAMYLKIADSLVFIKDHNTHRNYNFNTGWQTFLACIVYNHFLTLIANFWLYKAKETSVENVLGQKAKRTIEMIKYGQKCMSQEQFFGNISSISQQQNSQPSRIILDIEDEQEKQDQKEQQHEYFPDQPLKKKAFTSFCQEQGMFSAKRKNHVYKILNQNRRNFYLINKAQMLFKDYVEREKKIEEATGVGKELRSELSEQIQDPSILNNGMANQSQIRLEIPVRLTNNNLSRKKLQPLRPSGMGS